VSDAAGSIRPAVPEDRPVIEAVSRAAFGDHGDRVVRILREVEPTISLVAEADGAIVGHVMLSRMRMDEHRPLQLSPLSVAPTHQRRGIGSALAREALRIADATGEPLVLVLGHPGYYPRFGFEPAASLGLEAPPDYGSAWMAVRLAAYDPRLRGRVEFPPAFD
jgi:predicted N-acetyltransferase YhbS